MSKVPVREFIARAEEIAAEGPIYQLGKDGTHGECDCVGLIIGSIRRAGGQWRGMHGSNYAARNEMVRLEKVGDPSALEPGEVVYKAAEPDASNYTLPDRYKPGGSGYNGDIRDYFHIGIVVSASPLRIRHITGPGAVMDTKIGRWKYHGKLTKIDYESKGEAKTMQATVVLPAGSRGATVNLRSGASTNDKVLAQVPAGTVVDVIEDMGQWCRIEAQGYTGFMMSNYLEYPGGGEEVTGDVLTFEEREKIDNALIDIENRLEVIRSILGRG